MTNAPPKPRRCEAFPIILVVRNRKVMNKLIMFFKDEEGATAVEYGLMVALIAVVIIGVVSLLGTNVSTKFNNAATTIQGGS